MISVDNVYQKVLAIANKEQRGYITPQEFNLFADQAQMEIFGQYFYDLDQRQRGTGNMLDYADIQSNIEAKISAFEEYDQIFSFSSYGSVDLNGIPDLYKLGMIRVDYQTEQFFQQAEEIQLKELAAGDSPLTEWTKSRPVYTVMSSSGAPGIKIKVYPNPTPGDRVLVSYTRSLKIPKWTYLIGNNQNALYNPAAGDHQDFELHISEEPKLVVKILQLAGINMKDYNLAQLAGQKEISVIQQEKQ